MLNQHQRSDSSSFSSPHSPGQGGDADFSRSHAVDAHRGGVMGWDIGLALLDMAGYGWIWLCRNSWFIRAFIQPLTVSTELAVRNSYSLMLVCAPPRSAFAFGNQDFGWWHQRK